MIHDEIRNLLDAPPSGDKAPSLGDIEDALTVGYARALALDGERRQLEKKIADVVAHLSERSGNGGGSESELATLGRRLSAADGDLTSLRALLSTLRTRADATRATL
ncbi:MAG TPA: hypothetical protein VF025_06265 [Gaiellaceae bacterium]